MEKIHKIKESHKWRNIPKIKKATNGEIFQK